MLLWIVNWNVILWPDSIYVSGLLDAHVDTKPHVEKLVKDWSLFGSFCEL